MEAILKPAPGPPQTQDYRHRTEGNTIVFATMDYIIKVNKNVLVKAMTKLDKSSVAKGH